ncbi:MAG: polysaccharide deacetylase family protein [Gammaproteobacteria bacterium]|nr:polysaccharide deacetylase family protein [Gammaproteobacteria bacterium]
MSKLAIRLALTTAGALQRRLSIVLFHRVLSAPDALLPDEPDIVRFAEQISWLRDCFRILPLTDAAARLAAGTLPARALCITFDDGYRDNADNALPVLQDLGVPATFFVTTRYLAGGMMWNDRVVEAVRHWPEAHTHLDISMHGLQSPALAMGRKAVMENVLLQMKYLDYGVRETLADELLARSAAPARRMMMNESEIRTLHAAGMEIGGHTVSHPILCKLPASEARREIADNKSTLEQIIGAPLTSFAYPNGKPQRDYGAEHVAMLRERGYRYALTTSAGAANRSTSLLQLPRFTPWDRDATRYLARMAANYFRAPECVDESVKVAATAQPAR